MKTNRRNFIKGSALAATTLFVPRFLQAFGTSSGNNARKVLVVVQLSGGNDGLNTIVPFDNDLYHQARPGLGLKDRDLIRMSDEAAFHKSLHSFARMFDAGEVTILNSVGYPNPNRSHFRSMDIWHTASDADEYLTTGWIGRFLDNHCAGTPHPNAQALEINESLSLAMKGEKIKALSLQSPGLLHRTTQHPYLQALSTSDTNHGKADYLYKTLRETTASAEYLFEKTKTYRSNVSYPQNELGRQLQQVAQLINAGAATQIYYVSLSGFDTHAFQKWPQAKLLKQYSESLAAFTQDLKTGNRFNDTLIMTFSEFGRRVKQNASGGTDHGAANNLFLVGGQLKKLGFYNAMPNLSDLDDGDLKHEIDFREVYATLIEKWLGYDAKSTLRQDYLPLNLL